MGKIGKESVQYKEMAKESEDLGSISAGGPIVDQFFSTAPELNATKS